MKSLISLCRSHVPCYVTGWYLVFDVATLTDILVTWPGYVYTGTCHAYYLISDTGTCHAILIIWYLITVLAMLCLSFDIWYQYLPCYTYYLICAIGTCHAILIACYLTLDIITFDTWHAITRYWYTWPDFVALVLFYIFMTITFTGTWHDYYTVTR